MSVSNHLFVEPNNIETLAKEDRSFGSPNNITPQITFGLVDAVDDETNLSCVYFQGERGWGSKELQFGVCV